MRAALQAPGFERIELTIPERAADGIAFWKAQGFEPTGARDESGRHPIVTLARPV